jgi:hypothetical protein
MLSHVEHPASATIARAIAVLRKLVDSMKHLLSVYRPMRSLCRTGPAEIASKALRQDEAYEFAFLLGTSRWPMLL